MARKDIKEFLEKLRPFGDSLGNYLCEVVRMDATRRLLEREEPSLLKTASLPENAPRLFQFMKRASQEQRQFIFRHFPGEATFFQEVFSIFTKYPDASSFVKELLKWTFYPQNFLPEEACRRAFKEVSGKAPLHIVGAEKFLPCILEEMRFPGVRLHPSREDFSFFFKYILKDKPGVRVEGNYSPGSGDEILLSLVGGRLRLGIRLMGQLIRFLKAGVKRAVVVLPAKLLSSPSYALGKRELARFPVVKIIFLSGPGAILVAEKGNFKEVYIESPEGQGKVPLSLLLDLPLWSPSLLFSPAREAARELFARIPSLRLGDVAEVWRGYFLRKRKGGKGYKLVGVGNIEGGFLRVENLPEIGIEEGRGYEPLREGDLVIAARGTVFKVAEVPGTEEKILPSDSVIVIRPEDYPSCLLRFFFSTEIGRSLIEGIRRSGPLLNLSPRDLEEIPVPYPGREKLRQLGEEYSRAEGQYLRIVERARREFEKMLREIEKEMFSSTPEVPPAQSPPAPPQK